MTLEINKPITHKTYEGKTGDTNVMLVLFR